MSYCSADPGVASSSCLGPLCLAAGAGQGVNRRHSPHGENVCLLPTMGTVGEVFQLEKGFKPWSRTRTSLVTGAQSKQGDSANDRRRNLRGGRFQVFQKVQAGGHSSFLDGSI